MIIPLIEGTFYRLYLYWKSSPDNSSSKRGGSLTNVGRGIQAVRQFTLESRQAVEQADKVLFLIPEDLISEI